MALSLGDTSRATGIGITTGDAVIHTQMSRRTRRKVRRVLTPPRMKQTRHETPAGTGISTDIAVDRARRQSELVDFEGDSEVCVRLCVGFDWM